MVAVVAASGQTLLQKDTVSQFLQRVGKRCYKRIQWSQLLQRVGKHCYKRIQWLQLLQRVHC